MKKSLILTCFALASLALTAVADDSLTHNVGKVEMLVSDWGALTKVEDGGVFPNFGYSGKDYLDPFSEIWAGDAFGNVASAYDSAPDGVYLGEWQATVPSGRVEYVSDHPNASQIIHTQYAPDRYQDFPFKITLDQYTYAWDSTLYPDDDDYIVMKLVLKNLGDNILRNFYLAVQTNWDVDYNDERDDLIDWNAERKAGIAYDSDGTDHNYFALALMSGKFASHNIVDVQTWNYRDPDRSALMINGESDELSTINGMSGNYFNVITTGPHNISYGQSVTAIYVFAAGQDINELHKNLDAAKKRITTPGKLTAASTREAVNLTWTQGISPDVVLYKVYRSTTSGGGYTEIAAVSAETTSYSDTQVEIGTRYYYVATGIGPDGEESAYSSEVRASPGIPPPPPRNLTLKSGVSGNPILHWDSPAVERAARSLDGEVTGYRIFRNFTGSEPWTPIATVNASTQSFADENVYSGNTYYYVVASINVHDWTSDFSNVVSVSIERPGPSEPLADLSAVEVVPNPHSLSSGARIRFVNLTPRAKIRIYTLAGELIRTLYHTDESGEEEWDLRNDEGGMLASGIYVYYVESLKPEETAKISMSGKFAIIR